MRRYRDTFSGSVDPAHSPKLRFVIDLLRACKASEDRGGGCEKTIIFSNYKAPLEVFMDGVKAALGWEEREIIYIHGKVAQKQRMRM